MVLHGSIQFLTDNERHWIQLSELEDGQQVTIYDGNRNPIDIVAFHKSESIGFKKFTFTNTSGDSYDIMTTGKNSWDSYDFTNRRKLYAKQSLAIQPVYEDNIFINMRSPYHFFLGCAMSYYKHYKSGDAGYIKFLIEHKNFWKYQTLFEDYGYNLVDQTYRKGVRVDVVQKYLPHEDMQLFIQDMLNYRNMTDMEKADMFYGYYTCRDTHRHHIIQEQERQAVDFVQYTYKTSGFWLQGIEYKTPQHSNSKSQNIEKPYYELSFNHKQGYPSDIFDKTFAKRWTLSTIGPTEYDTDVYDVFIAGAGTLDNGLILREGITMYLDYDEEDLSWNFENVNEDVEASNTDDDIDFDDLIHPTEQSNYNEDSNLINNIENATPIEPPSE